MSLLAPPVGSNSLSPPPLTHLHHPPLLHRQSAPSGPGISPPLGVVSFARGTSFDLQCCLHHCRRRQGRFSLRCLGSGALAVEKGGGRNSGAVAMADDQKG